MMTYEIERPATFFLSVDVTHQHEQSSLVHGVHEILRRYHVKALWSFEFKRHPEVVTSIVSSASEFGLLAVPDWSSPACERTVFAQELSARIHRAGELGIRPFALALTNGDAPSHFDLLLKHQLAILRTRNDKVAAGGQCFQPRLARYGIWEAEPMLLLPTSSRWSLPWTFRRMLQRALGQRQTVHVVVNVEAMFRSVTSGLSSLDYVLKRVAARREAGLIRVVSAREMLELYNPRRENLLSRSVLRAA